MQVNEAVEAALRPTASCEDRCRRLSELADLVGTHRPSLGAVEDPETAGYDITTVVAGLCSLFGELDGVPPTEEETSNAHNSAEIRSVTEAALAVVAALPFFSLVISPTTVSDAVRTTKIEPGHMNNHVGEGNERIGGVLNGVMRLIEQVTKTVCSILSSRTEPSVDVVVPLYRLITRWQCAFRGKADCLRIVDQLFLVLLGHDGCCEVPGAAGVCGNIAARSPLWLSDRLQHTVDVYHCIVSTFRATAAPDFNEWVVTTPYWVTLLNVAAGHACAFTAEDVLGGHTPARHSAGLVMLECLAGSPFTYLAVNMASTMLLLTHVWKPGVRSQRYTGEPVESLFVAIKASSSYVVRPNDRWFDVCPSAECGSMILTGWLARNTSSLADETRILPGFTFLMMFLVLTGARDRPALEDRLSSRRLMDFDLAVQCSYAVRPAESMALRLAALRAAAHFAESNRSLAASSLGTEIHTLVAEKDIAVCADEPVSITVAELDVCLAVIDDKDFPTVGIHCFKAEFAAHVLNKITPVLFEHHAVDRAALAMYWRLCSAVLSRQSALAERLDTQVPDLLRIAQHAMAELEKGRASIYEAPAKTLVQAPRADDRRFVRRFHKQVEAPSHASVLSACVVKCVFHLWERGPVLVDITRRIVQWLDMDLKRVCDVAPLAGPEGSQSEARREHAYVRTIDAARSMIRLRQVCGSDVSFVTLFDTAIELSKLLQQYPLIRPLLPLIDTLVSFIAVDKLGENRCAAAFELCCREDVLLHCRGDLLATLVRRVYSGAFTMPPIDPFLWTLGRMLLGEQRVTELRQAALLVSEAVSPGAATMSNIKLVWAGVANTVPDEGDEWCWVYFAGQLLRAVPRQQLPSASLIFMNMFLPSPLDFPDALSHEQALFGIAPLCAFVQFADPSAVKERSRDITDSMRCTLAVNYGAYLRLAQCVIDNALECRGMTIDLNIIRNVMTECRRVLHLPSHVHPSCVRRRYNSSVNGPEDADDVEDNGSGSHENSAASGAATENPSEADDDPETDDEREEGDSEDYDSENSDRAPIIQQPLIFPEDIPGFFFARRAIAALLAVAEWMHRHCTTTVVVSTVQQGPVLERTVTASSDALRQLDPDAAAAAPTAAAMVVSSVAHWLLEIGHCRLALGGPVGSPSMFQETQQLWDRVIRWAMDPSLNVALLMTLPVPREQILEFAASLACLSPWAAGAVEEALAPTPLPTHRATHRALNSSKRPR